MTGRSASEYAQTPGFLFLSHLFNSDSDLLLM